MNAVRDFVDEGSMAFQESFELGEYDLGECLVPLKATHELPKTNNTLRNVTQHTNGPLPPSPAIVKKKNMARLASPSNSPGSLSKATIATANATLNGRRSVRSSIQNPLGGSLHGRGSSPGALGGSRLGRRPGEKSRTRSISPDTPLIRSRSPGPLGGSLHGRTSSPTPLFAHAHAHGGPPGGLPMRRRSNSPGSLKSASLHGTSTLRPRSRSPGAFQGRNRSFRLSRRMSTKCIKGPTGLVSILRKGKFSGDATTTTAPASATSSCSSLFPGPEPTPGTSPSDSPGCFSSSSHHRKRHFMGKRVSFWFPDEQSLACSFATEESMAFGDLGFDDSGEGFGCEDDYGLRTIRGGELPFIEVMGDYARGGVDDDDDDDYLVKRFNGSTIHEELGASLGEGNFTSSFSSLLSDETDEDHHDKDEDKAQPSLQAKEQEDQQKDYSQQPDRRSSCLDSSQDDWSDQSSHGSFALPDNGEDDVIAKTKKSKGLNKDKAKDKDKDKAKDKEKSKSKDKAKTKTKESGKNKSKKTSAVVLDDHDEVNFHQSFCVDQGSFALPDLDDDADMPMTKKTTNQSKKSKVKDKNDKKESSSVNRGRSTLPVDLEADVVSQKKAKQSKKKTKEDKKKNMNMDGHESFFVSQGSFALADFEEDIITYEETKRNKSKSVQDIEDSDVDKQESVDVSQGSFALPDIADEEVMQLKTSSEKTGPTTSNKNSDDGRQDSFAENQDSFVSLVFAEDETLHKTNTSKGEGDHKGQADVDDDNQESFYASQGSFALPDSMDSSSLSCSPYHQYNQRGRARQQHPLFCQLPRSRRRNPTPPPTARFASRAASGGAGSSSSTLSSSSFSSSLRLEEALLTPVRQPATLPQQTSTSWCCSESSLELSALKESSKIVNRDSLSETSSESPTSVTELAGVSSQIVVGGGEENGLNPIPVDDEEDTEHRRLTVKRSMVSSLVPPIG